MCDQTILNLHVEKGGELRIEPSLIKQYNSGETTIRQNTNHPAHVIFGDAVGSEHQQKISAPAKQRQSKQR